MDLLQGRQQRRHLVAGGERNGNGAPPAGPRQAEPAAFGIGEGRIARKVGLHQGMGNAVDHHLALLGPGELFKQRDVLHLHMGEEAVAAAAVCGGDGEADQLLAEPADIAAAAAAMFENTAWSGRRLVITAGPTQEAIDPVRYLSNHSSGKMGFAIAEAAAAAGARVTLIAGPVALSTPPRVERVDVVTAAEMLAASEQHSASADVFIAAAAVADYRLAEPAQRKIKKRNDAPSMTLELIENPDILATIAAKTNSKRPQFAIGFAAETHDLLDHAEDKMRRKNLDMIIANDVSRSDIGFAADQNEVTVLVGDEAFTLPLASKSKLARQLLEQIAARLLAS